MKNFLNAAVNVYHLLFSSSLRSCRYEPTCSQYLLDSVEKYGSIQGITKTFVRVLSCHPFTKRPIIDPA